MLERTRRAVFRIFEELHEISEAMRDTGVEALGVPADIESQVPVVGVEHPGWLAAGPGNPSPEPQLGRGPRGSRPLTSFDDTQVRGWFGSSLEFVEAGGSFVGLWMSAQEGSHRGAEPENIELAISDLHHMPLPMSRTDR